MITAEKQNHELFESFKKLDAGDIKRICAIWIEQNQLQDQQAIYEEALYFLIKSIHLLRWDSIEFQFFGFEGNRVLKRHPQQAENSSNLKTSDETSWFHTDGTIFSSSTPETGDTVYIVDAKFVIEAVKIQDDPDSSKDILKLSIWEKHSQYIKLFIEYVLEHLHPF